MITSGVRWIVSLVTALCLLAAGAARPGDLGENRRESASAAKAKLEATPAQAASRLAAARADAHRTAARLPALPPFAAPAGSAPPPAPRGAPYAARALVVAAADQARPACSSRGPPRG
jgi:hypothetical protein